MYLKQTFTSFHEHCIDNKAFFWITTVEQHKIIRCQKKGITLISWLIRRWQRHGDNVERLWTHTRVTQQRETLTVFLHSIETVKCLCIVVMTTLGQCWSRFNQLWDNRRRWQREWWKMVSERGIHRSRGRWSWEMLWMSPKEIFSTNLEEKLHSVSNYFLFVKIILYFQRLWALAGQLGLDTSVANTLRMQIRFAPAKTVKWTFISRFLQSPLSFMFTCFGRSSGRNKLGYYCSLLLHPVVVQHVHARVRFLWSARPSKVNCRSRGAGMIFGRTDKVRVKWSVQ